MSGTATQAGSPAPSFGRARAAVAATFATHAVFAGTLGPWIPRLKAQCGLDAAGLGLALAGYAAGLILGTRLAGPALRRAGGRRVIRAGIPILAAGLALLPAAHDLVSLAAALAWFGLASGLLDVSMNAEAVAVELRCGRRVMSSMHGTWSVSVLVGAAIASGGLAAGVPIGIHFPIVAALFAAASAPLLGWLPVEAAERDGAAPEAGAPRAAGRIIFLCLVGAAAFLSEGVALEWSAVYLRESVGAAPGTAGLGVVAFSAGMTASRFAGDRLSGRFDGSAIARAGTSIAALALAGALVLGGAPLAIAAFAIMGLGLGPVVPLAFRAAGATSLGPGRTALGIVVTSGYVGSIVGPLVVGFVAHAIDLRAGFGLPVVMCAAAALASGSLRSRS